MEIVLRATVVFFFLFVVLKVVGRKELSEMTPLDIVMLVVLGDLVQQGITQEDFSLTGAGLAAGTIVFWTFTLSLLSFRSSRAAAIIDGEPLLLVRDGATIDRVMRANRVTLSQLREQAREHGIDDLAKVRVAILEGEGKISFIQDDAGS